MAASSESKWIGHQNEPTADIERGRSEGPAIGERKKGFRSCTRIIELKYLSHEWYILYTVSCKRHQTKHTFLKNQDKRQTNRHEEKIEVAKPIIKHPHENQNAAKLYLVVMHLAIVHA
jgi:hypothetical protein